MSQIVNPTGKSRFFSTAGSVISAQPTNTKFSMSATGDNTTRLSVAKVTEKGKKGVFFRNGHANITDTVALTQDYSALSTYQTVNAALVYDGSLSGQIKTGDYVLTNKGYVFRVKAVLTTSATNDTIIMPFPQTSAATYMTLTGGTTNPLAVIPVDAITPDRPDNNVAVGLPTKVSKTTTSTSIVAGTSTPNVGPNQRKALRNSKTSTAIRAGYWNEYTGKWTTLPSVENNTTDIDNDQSLVKYQISFSNGVKPSNN